MDKSSPSDLSGLRGIAVFELAKGVLILLLGFGVLALIHKNLDDIAERLTEALRVNPEGKLSNLFVDLANHATDATLWVLAIGALVDASFLTHGVADPPELPSHLFIQFDDLVEGLGDLGVARAAGQ